MKRKWIACLACGAWLAISANVAWADLLCQRWGPKEAACSYPDTLKVQGEAGYQRLIFDLSALAKDAKVRRARLCFATGGAQPREPVQIVVLEEGKPHTAGKVLELLPPLHDRFDVTGTVKAWVADPAKNLGLAVVRFDGFNAKKCWLDIMHEGKADKSSAPVTELRAAHHDGQTFLAWKELPLFQPAADKVFYVNDVGGQNEVSKTPGKGNGGLPLAPAITLKDLRDLARLSVRGNKGPREMQPLVKTKDLPEIRYRVYRGKEKITPATIQDAVCVGESAPLNAYVERMTVIHTEGEYYNPYEVAESIIPTWCVEDGKPLVPGEAFFVNPVVDAGKFHYAVTVVENGTENLSNLASGNVLAEPIEEKPGTPRPVLQYVRNSGRAKGGLEYWHAYWLTPPVANLPRTDPRRVIVTTPASLTPPAALSLDPSAGDMFFNGRPMVYPNTVHLLIEEDFAYSPCLAYNDGLYTLRSYRESKVDYFSDRYLMACVDWAMGKWPIDKAKIAVHAPTHFAIRHPDVFRVLYIGAFEFDVDRKWNPGAGALLTMFGPQEMATTTDGKKAWDIIDIAWYMAQDVGRDIPFMVGLFDQPKDGNHGAEFGWQDDPKGYAALQKFRQPHCAQWGGASISPTLRKHLADMRWDKSVPAFTGCSLDNNPGNGDPDDGDMWGQINGYLFWDYDSIVDKPDAWEMTILLTPDCPQKACTVNITPRWCAAFKCKEGRKLKWTNTGADGKVIQSNTVPADKFGLATLANVVVTKGKNRIAIAAE